MCEKKRKKKKEKIDNGNVNIWKKSNINARTYIVI